MDIFCRIRGNIKVNQGGIWGYLKGAVWVMQRIGKGRNFQQNVALTFLLLFPQNRKLFPAISYSRLRHSKWIRLCSDQKGRS